MKLLMVCLGNICRSPAAAAAVREAAAEAGLEIEVDSAGTGPWHVGDPPHPQVRAAGKRAGLDIDGTARQLTRPAELEGYDLILAMDRSNLANLRRLAPHLADRIHLYRSFDPEAGEDEVPDPYGLDDTAYDETVEIVRRAAQGLIDSLAGNHSWPIGEMG